MTITKWLAKSAVAAAFAASVGYGAVLATTNGSARVDNPTPGRGAQVEAASNGDIVIGTTATSGDIHIGRATSDPDSGGQVSAVLDQNAPPTIRD
jgi:hypothetical protein